MSKYKGLGEQEDPFMLQKRLEEKELKNSKFSAKKISLLREKNEVSKSGKAKDFNTYSISILAGLGINYDVSQLLRIKIEPILNYSNSSVMDAPISESLQNVGLNIGLGFKIK